MLIKFLLQCEKCMLCEWQWVFFFTFWHSKLTHNEASTSTPFQSFSKSCQNWRDFFLRIICDPARLAVRFVCFSLSPWFLLFSYSHILSDSCFQMHSSAFSFPTYCILCSLSDFLLFSYSFSFQFLFFLVPRGARSETLTVAGGPS